MDYDVPTMIALAGTCLLAGLVFISVVAQYAGQGKRQLQQFETSLRLKQEKANKARQLAEELAREAEEESKKEDAESDITVDAE